MKNCLDCKYEPDWSGWTDGVYKRCGGACKWSKTIPDLPAVYNIIGAKHVIRYDDDSGVYNHCKTWEPKS